MYGMGRESKLWFSHSKLSEQPSFTLFQSLRMNTELDSAKPSLRYRNTTKFECGALNLNWDTKTPPN